MPPEVQCFQLLGTTHYTRITNHLNSLLLEQLDRIIAVDKNWLIRYVKHTLVLQLEFVMGQGVDFHSPGPAITPCQWNILG